MRKRALALSPMQQSVLRVMKLSRDACMQTDMLAANGNAIFAGADMLGRLLWCVWAVR